MGPWGWGQGWGHGDRDPAEGTLGTGTWGWGPGEGTLGMGTGMGTPGWGPRGSVGPSRAHGAPPGGRVPVTARAWETPAHLQGGHPSHIPPRPQGTGDKETEGTSGTSLPPGRRQRVPGGFSQDCKSPPGTRPAPGAKTTPIPREGQDGEKPAPRSLSHHRPHRDHEGNQPPKATGGPKTSPTWHRCPGPAIHSRVPKEVWGWGGPGEGSPAPIQVPEARRGGRGGAGDHVPKATFPGEASRKNLAAASPEPSARALAPCCHPAGTPPNPTKAQPSP